MQIVCRLWRPISCRHGERTSMCLVRPRPKLTATASAAELTTQTNHSSVFAISSRRCSGFPGGMTLTRSINAVAGVNRQTSGGPVSKSRCNLHPPTHHQDGFCLHHLDRDLGEVAGHHLNILRMRLMQSLRRPLSLHLVRPSPWTSGSCSSARTRCSQRA